MQIYLQVQYHQQLIYIMHVVVMVVYQCGKHHKIS
jgi:hypothetical protein